MGYELMKLMESMTPADIELHQIFMGVYFGYPDCCIEWFVTRKGSYLTPKQHRAHLFRGFIPCPGCAEKIDYNTINSLITDRICHSPFPVDNIETP